MKRTTLVLAVLALSSVLWAADNAGVDARPTANHQLPFANPHSLDAITIPQMLSYQGKLTDTMGIPVPNGNYSTRFRLYTQASGGTHYWQETQSVSTEDGLFAVLLGSVTPIPTVPEAGNLYLGMKVGSDAEMTPRIRTVSAAYAYLCRRADTADFVASARPSGSAGGDLTGTYPDPTVDGIRGRAVGSTAPSTNQVLKWSGSQWVPRNDSVGGGGGGTVTSVSQSTGITCSPNPITTAGTVRLNTSYSDGRYVNSTGDSITGALAIGAPLRVHDKAALGYSCYNNGFAAFCAGYGNSAGGDRASITGGEDNSAGGQYSHIGGGSENQTTARWSTIGGGNVNEATDTAATIAGGLGNFATASYATVGGGQNNTASVRCATVAGGSMNSADSSYATVAGGRDNTASGTRSFIGGGTLNDATGQSSVVTGGTAGIASGQGSFVGGGIGNDALGKYSTIAGGDNNSADSSHTFVGGGRYNDALGRYATIAGGYYNEAESLYATVGGGTRNRAEDRGATASGGRYSVAGGQYSTVAGGNSNYAPGENASIGGGYANRAIGECATVPGGYIDSAAADYSFATNNRSVVPVSYTNSAAFNGQTATASNQTRVGALSKASGTFTIDHPLDPAGKILNHYFIEGPEMLNIYRGSVVLDASGRAEVSLPDYFSALNRNPMVQLTGVGTSGVVYLAEKVSGNRFVVGGPAGAEVYWQVTGERKDVSAEVTRRIMPVEQPKTGKLAGRALDDEFLSGCMDQLAREGKASGINFRTAGGRQRYDRMKQNLGEPGRQ